MIHFVVSSPAAALPVIDRYGLEERRGGAFPLYMNGETSLTVSGAGKMATAAAAGWLFHAAGGVVDGAWLHLGLAGHAETDIGTGLLAFGAAELCVWLHTPLPWMIGPLVATALATLAGVPTQSALSLRNMGQWTIGGALGLYFTPEVLHMLATLWWAGARQAMEVLAMA